MSFIKRLLKSAIQGKITQFEDWRDPDRSEDDMPCAQFTLEGIDKSLHDKLMAQAVTEGATFDGDSVTLHGITLQWDWDEPSSNLHITPIKHPFYFGCAEIEGKIRELVEKARTAI